MENQPVYYLFVYGSLRSGFHSPAYEYISRYFDLVSNGKVKGKLYDLGEYPAAIPTDEETYIIGELYHIKEVSEFSWAIGQLDDYEGLNVEEGETQLYRRELQEVITDGKPYTAWIYWYNQAIEGKPLVASGDMLEYKQNKEQGL